MRVGVDGARRGAVRLQDWQDARVVDQPPVRVGPEPSAGVLCAVAVGQLAPLALEAGLRHPNPAGGALALRTRRGMKLSGAYGLT